MTDTPLDTQALRRDMEYLSGDTLARESRWAGTVSPVEVLALLDRLDQAEARIRAVEDALDEWAVIDPEKFNTDDVLGILDDIRRALDGDA